MDKYKGKYRRTSTRLRNWDYGSAAPYFITICTKNRIYYFGEIEDKKMFHSHIGEIVIEKWLETEGIRSDMNVSLDEFVVMPNHFHAIVWIGTNLYNSFGYFPNKFGPQSKNLASIMGGFKGSVTSYSLENEIPFNWQKKYHDRIIRDEFELYAVRKYIIENPQNWEDDEFR